MKTIKTFLLILLVVGILPGLAVAQKKAFIQTVDMLIGQIDVQVEDRNRLVKELRKLSASLTGATLKNLDNRILVARNLLVERESLLTAETLIDEPNKYVVKTKLIEFLHRVTENDQTIYDDYVEQKASTHFELDKQLSKIRTEQTQLAAIRRDLEKVKFYPMKKERAAFFLSAVSNVLDGFRKVKDLDL